MGKDRCTARLSFFRFIKEKALQIAVASYNSGMNEKKKEAVDTRPESTQIRFNRRTGEQRRVHNFRLGTAASDKLRKLAASKQVSQAAIIERLIAQAK